MEQTVLPPEGERSGLVGQRTHSPRVQSVQRRPGQARLRGMAGSPGGQRRGRIDEEATEAIRRGWYLGKETFKDKLLKMLERPVAGPATGTRRAAGANRDHGEKEALRIIREGGRLLGLPTGLLELSRLKKSDERKTRLASC